MTVYWEGFWFPYVADILYQTDTCTLVLSLARMEEMRRVRERLLALPVGALRLNPGPSRSGFHAVILGLCYSSLGLT